MITSGRSIGARAAPLLAGAIALAACAPPAPASRVDGHTIVAIDPSRPGDTRFAGALDLYRQAETEQAAARAARKGGDAATATAQFALAVRDYGLAREGFDQLSGDPALCPSVSIRCDNAAYLAGRSSYERGTVEHDQAVLIPDATLLPVSQSSLADARARLDAMLAAFPASAFVDSAAYFDGRARFELTAKFAVGSYADAEPRFEQAYAANTAGVWSDNALYYDGRCEFEDGLAQVASEASFLALADLAQAQLAYDRARLLLDQSIGAEAGLLAAFPASSYRDNAAYYLGRAWLEKPTPDVAPGVAPGTVPDTERVANLGRARDALTIVVGMPTSPLYAGARYWRGRAHYALWFHQVGSNAELDAAVADLHAIPPTSTWRDNGLAYAVRSLVHLGDTAGACADYTLLQDAFATSAYTTSARTALCSYLTAGGLTCPAGSAAFTCP